MGSPQRLKSLIPLISGTHRRIVVLSAMSGTTNTLLEIAICLYSNDNDKALNLIQKLSVGYHRIVEETFDTDATRQKGHELVENHFNFITEFTRDLFTANEEKAILAQGELLSTALFHLLLTEKNIDSELLPALNFMRLNVAGEPDLEYIKTHINQELDKTPDQKLYITQGYICRNAFGEIDNLKRGGSDYTATLMGAVLNASEIQIWTDIDGMHNNDPRIVNHTAPVSKLTFDEAAELAYFGAKILHPTCILPARLHNIPVKLRNTLNPEAEGTLISAYTANPGIRAIAAKDGITAIKIKSGRMLLAYGFLRAVFEVFERYHKPIDMITTSEVAVSLTVDNNENLNEIEAELKNFGTVDITPELTIISVVGHFPADKPGYASSIFKALEEIPVRMISYGGSEYNISFLVKTDLKVQAMRTLHENLFNRNSL